MKGLSKLDLSDLSASWERSIGLQVIESYGLLFAGIVLCVCPVYVVLAHLLGVQRSGFGLICPVKKLPHCSVICRAVLVGEGVAEQEVLQRATSAFACFALTFPKKKKKAPIFDMQSLITRVGVRLLPGCVHALVLLQHGSMLPSWITVV